jgi:hypothetical protein
LWLDARAAAEAGDLEVAGGVDGWFPEPLEGVEGGRVGDAAAWTAVVGGDVPEEVFPDDEFGGEAGEVVAPFVEAVLEAAQGAIAGDHLRLF